MDHQTKVIRRAETVLGDPSTDFLTAGEHLDAVAGVSAEAFNELLAKARMNSRRARYFLAIHRAFHGLGVPASRLQKIGWSKLKDIAPHVTKDSVSELLVKAETLAGKDLERELQGLPPLGKAKAINLRFHPDDYAKVETALIKYGALPLGRGLEAKEEALLALIESTLSNAE